MRSGKSETVMEGLREDVEDQLGNPMSKRVTIKVC